MGIEKFGMPMANPIKQTTEIKPSQGEDVEIKPKEDLGSGKTLKSEGVENKETKELTHAEKVALFEDIGRKMIVAFKTYEEQVRNKYGVTKENGIYNGNPKMIEKAKEELNSDEIKGVRGLLGTVRDAINDGKYLSNLGIVLQGIYDKSPSMNNLFDGINLSEFNKSEDKKTSYLGQGIRNNA